MTHRAGAYKVTHFPTFDSTSSIGDGEYSPSFFVVPPAVITCGELAGE